MAKQQFISDLEEIINEPIVLTQGNSHLSEEISINEWGIALPTLSDGRLTIGEVQKFLRDVKRNRQAQLVESGLQISLRYYSWFDYISMQLRFIVINLINRSLGFRSNVDVVDDEKEVIDAFLFPPLAMEISFEDLLEGPIDQNLLEKKVMLYSEEIHWSIPVQ